MSWNTTLVNRLRFYINDNDNPEKYSDTFLAQYIAIAATQVVPDLALDDSFVVDTDTPTISPDPLTLDIGIGNLFVLKAAVIITRGEMRKDVARFGIRIRDDLTFYDGTHALKGRTNTLKMYEDTYKDALWNWKVNNRPAVRGIFGPFTPDTSYEFHDTYLLDERDSLMTGLIPRSLIDQFQETVDEFNSHYDNEGLGKNCTLIFESGITPTINSTLSTPTPHTTIGLSYGGRSLADQTTGRDVTSNVTDSGTVLQERETTKTITARIYPINKPYLRMSLGVAGNQNIWQMNTHKQYIPDILRCKEAIFDTGLTQKTVRVRLFKPPVAYGLGEAYQCLSYWEELPNG